MPQLLRASIEALSRTSLFDRTTAALAVATFRVVAFPTPQTPDGNDVAVLIESRLIFRTASEVNHINNRSDKRQT